MVKRYLSKAAMSRFWKTPKLLQLPPGLQHGNHLMALCKVLFPKAPSKLSRLTPTVGRTVELENGTKFKNVPLHDGKICKFFKALYGPAYSPRAFHNHLNKWL